MLSSSLVREAPGFMHFSEKDEDKNILCIMLIILI